MLRRNPRSVRQLTLRVAIAACVLLAGGCNKIDKLQGQIDKLTATVDRIGTDASDVGVVSELGWLSKLLRDSATGDSKRQAEVREAVSRLFGLNPSELQDDFFQVSLQVGGYELEKNQELQVDLKFVDSPTREVVAQFFAQGNGWQPRSVRDVYEVRRSEAEIRKLVEDRVSSLLSPVHCKPGHFHRDKFDADRAGSCGFEWTGDWVKQTAATDFDAPAVKNAMEKSKNAFIKQMSSSILAPLEVAGLPPSGAINGQIQRSWGLTNIGLYAVAFVPQATVKQHPKMTLRAWLHVKGQPNRILGAETQIEAPDFAERCLGKIENPSEPIPSLTSAGPLCWYAFDLFSVGSKARISELKKEVAASSIVKK
jgi:hypothetical protein